MKTRIRKKQKKICEKRLEELFPRALELWRHKVESLCWGLYENTKNYIRSKKI